MYWKGCLKFIVSELTGRVLDYHQEAIIRIADVRARLKPGEIPGLKSEILRLLRVC
jgi:hypothetical protein